MKCAVPISRVINHCGGVTDAVLFYATSNKTPPHLAVWLLKITEMSLSISVSTLYITGQILHVFGKESNSAPVATTS